MWFFIFHLTSAHRATVEAENNWYFSILPRKGCRVKSSTQHGEENKTQDVNQLVFWRNVPAFVLGFGVAKRHDPQLQQEERAGKPPVAAFTLSFLHGWARTHWSLIWSERSFSRVCAKMMVGARRGLILRFEALHSSPCIRWKISRSRLTVDWANVIWWNISSTGRSLFLTLPVVLITS